MNKISKRKLLLTTGFLMLLIICSTYAYYTPAVEAQVTAQQKALSITNNVLGINTASFNITSKGYPSTPQTAFLGIVPQETIIYNLTSSQRKLNLLYTFANENLQLLEVLDDGHSSAKQAPLPNAMQVNAVGAQAFLSHYQVQTGNLLYDNLRSILNAMKGNINQTFTSGNIRLESTSYAEGSTNFKWYYTVNGASAAYTKFIALDFDNGRLTAFVDNWSIYNIGNTEVNVSKEKAIAIALEAAKEYATNMSLQTYGFKTNNINETSIQWSSLVLDSSLNANMTRSADKLALYPDWRFGIQLDKWYGEMYGIEVDVWADTGQVRDVQGAYSAMTPPENASVASPNGQVTTSGLNTNALIFISFPIIGLTIAGVPILWANYWKKLGFKQQGKFSKKIVVIMFCLIMVLPIFMESIGTANATNRGAVVWGSQSDGGINPDGSHWRKSSDEITDQKNTAGNISYYFSQNGYTGNPDINHQGTTATKAQINTDIIDLQNSNDYIAVVDFDHGVGGTPQLIGEPAPPDEWHYMFEDDTGTLIGNQSNYITNYNHGVFDMDIHQWVQQNKVAFAFINTCLSADTTTWGQGMLPAEWPAYPERAIGMPFAWTNRLVENPSTYSGFTITQDISNDGYNNPDWGYQVYIGFPYGSASLSQGIPFDGGGGNPYYYWVYSFFYNALCTSQTVNQALNSASLQFLGHNFGDSALRTGFPAYWWNLGTQPGSTMAVYGNGNIRLQQFTPPADVANPQSINGPTEGADNTQIGPFSAFAANPYGNSVQYQFSWGDGSYNTTDYYPDGQPATGIYHSWSSSGTYSVSFRAKTQNSDWSSWSNAITVNIDPAPTYTTTINVYYTWGGDPDYITYQYSYNTQLAYGSNYLDFTNGPYGGYFMQAYDYADSSMHYSSADTYWTDYGTSIDVLWTW